MKTATGSAPERLTVAVNLTWLAPSRVGGSEEYLVRQLTGIAQGAGGDNLDVHLFCQPDFIDDHPRLTDALASTPMPLQRDLRGGRIVAENSWLPSHTRNYDVVHHGGGTVPFVHPGPVVLTIHDLQYLRYPDYFSRGRRAWLTAMMPRSVRAADVIAVPSNYVRNRVIDVFGSSVDPETVRVVRHGLPPMVIPGPAQIAEARVRHQIRGSYIAYAAITHPHKGHTTLIDMLATTRSPAHPLHDHQLVLIGGEGPAEIEVQRAIAASGVADRIIRTGRVSGSDRDALIAGADVLAFPSRYEGFGAPLVEAMALDTPVVANEQAAIVEVVGDAGVIVPEHDPVAWADAIVSVLSDAEGWVGAGRVRRQAFTVERSGAELGDAYRAAFSMGGRSR